MGSNDVPLNDITGPLTDRQHEVLSRIALGEDHASIATRFKVGRAAISQDVRRIVIKTESRSTAHAVATYSEEATLRRLASELPSYATPGDAYDALISEALSLSPNDSGINPVHSAALYARSIVLYRTGLEIMAALFPEKVDPAEVLPHVAHILTVQADAVRPENYGPARVPASA